MPEQRDDLAGWNHTLSSQQPAPTSNERLETLPCQVALSQGEMREQWVSVRFAGNDRPRTFEDVSLACHQGQLGMQPDVKSHTYFKCEKSLLAFMLVRSSAMKTLQVTMSCCGVQRLDTPALEYCQSIPSGGKANRFLGTYQALRYC